MRAQILDLGVSVDRAWLERGRTEDAFAAIAAKAMRDSEMLLQDRADEIFGWILAEPVLPQQQYRDFGQPALTLYQGHKFYIELLPWIDGTTAIHQHSFAGAFGVLRGSSLHCRYDFECHDALSSELRVGRLGLTTCEVLKRGDVREIHPGCSFIHSLFHLDRPSLTLVVRTTTLARFQPQYSYRRSGLAFDPFFNPEPAATRVRLLKTLFEVSDRECWHHATSLMARSDPWHALAILGVAHRWSESDRRWDDLVDVARARHSRCVEVVLASLQERSREQKIVAMRREVHDPDHRFFLAILLNLPDRSAIYAAITARYPGGDPEMLALKWMGELSGDRKIGLEFDPLSLKMLHFVLRDRTLQEFERGLASVFGQAQVTEQAESLEILWNQLRDTSLLQPLIQSTAENVA